MPTVSMRLSDDQVTAGEDRTHQTEAVKALIERETAKLYVAGVTKRP